MSLKLNETSSDMGISMIKVGKVKIEFGCGLDFHPQWFERALGRFIPFAALVIRYLLCVIFRHEKQATCIYGLEFQAT